MKIFIDSAELSNIREFNSLGIIDGVTTNPSLISKFKNNYKRLLADICDEVSGPVSAEVRSHSCEDMVKEGKELSKIASNIVVKLPLTDEGLKACRKLVNEGCQVNVTLCFSANQALLAAKAGATFVSPFVGRLDDIAANGMTLISDICTIFNNYVEINTKVIVASIRNPMQVSEAGKIGANIVTVPAETLSLLVKHPLTDKGINIFDLAWKS
ncbi:MAG: fructose-6-phosphate aldolase [Rickettsiaceae bacterium H1]|nr:fructose-6-phosphate aldolase [Rickettsiaceae bacterium H1]